MKAIIAGATGLVGSLVVQKLLLDSRFSEIVSVARRSLPVQHPKLAQVLIPDFSQLGTVADQLKGDVYFCCLGSTIKAAGSQESFRKVDFEAVLEFGKLAKAFDAKSFVLISAMGANSKSSIFYNRVKGETEEALQALKLRSLCIFRPGLLVGHRSQPRAGEKFANLSLQLLSPILPRFLEKTLATPAEELAKRMIEISLAAPPDVEVISSAKI